MASLFTAVGDSSKKIKLLKTRFPYESHFVKRFNIENSCLIIIIIINSHDHHPHHHVPDLFQTFEIMALQSSDVSPPDELIVGRFFSRYEIIQTVCVVFFCFWYHKSFRSIFAFIVHQPCLYTQKTVVVFIWRF